MKIARMSLSLFLVTSLILLATFVRTESASAQATTTKTVIIIPAEDAINPEALEEIAECTGEEVTFTNGAFQVVILTTTLSSGVTRVNVQGHAHGISGTGAESGATYHATGALRVVFEDPEDPPLVFSSLENFNIIGPAGANSLRIQTQVHVTVNANGVVTASIDSVRAVCQ